jgi:hypothetical protein
MKYIRNAQILILIAVSITTISFLSCEKQSANTVTAEPLLRKGGNGKNNNGGGISPADSAFRDSLFTACGMSITDTGCTYQTVVLNNITSRHLTRYSYDPATGANTHPYDNIIISFDPPVIQGKVINCYMLLADQCQGRPVCTKMNGIYASQVTTCGTLPTFCLPIGVTWLNPNVQTYTGFIYIGTVGGCVYLSQPFTFEPPRIL